MVHQVVKPEKIAATAAVLLEEQLVVPAVFRREGIDKYKGAADDTINVVVEGVLPFRTYGWRNDRSTEIVFDEYKERKVAVRFGGDMYNGVSSPTSRTSSTCRAGPSSPASRPRRSAPAWRTSVPVRHQGPVRGHPRRGRARTPQGPDPSTGNAEPAPGTRRLAHDAGRYGLGNRAAGGREAEPRPARR